MFARFNLLAKPLEDERPRVMTLDQLKTSYLFHLRTIITGPEEVELTRDIKAAERDRDIHRNEPLSRYEIHLWRYDKIVRASSNRQNYVRWE